MTTLLERFHLVKRTNQARERGVRSIRIPNETYDKLKGAADKEDRNMTKLLARAVDFYFLHRNDVREIPHLEE